MPDLLPPNAANSERAMALAVEDPITIPIRQLWSPTTCPAAQLPWLAWALSVDEWDSTWPEATKRAAIADSIEAHRKKGTVGALRRALQRLGYEVEIDENTGAAYTFKLRFRVREGDATGGAVLDSAVVQATTLALKQKNVRSYLADTDLLAETDPAALWIGGAVISGAECSIVGAPTPLPLDPYTSRTLGSFWTVRMRTDYFGPIARVKRTSDNAILDYYSLSELEPFVAGDGFEFVQFYNQDGAFRVLTVSTGDATGEIDANGIPYLWRNDFNSLAMAVNVSPIALSGYRVLLASRTTDDGLQSVQVRISSAPSPGESFLINSGNLIAASRNGSITQLSSASVDARVIGGTFDPTARKVTNGTSNASTTTTTNDLVARSIRLKIDGGMPMDHASFYGCAVLRESYDLAEFDDLIATIETHLQF